MNWNLIEKVAPPRRKWLEFYDGNKTMRLDLLNHIDKIDQHGDCICHYLHNYTHWRYLSAPNT